MSIVASEIHTRLTITTGAVGNSLPQPNQNLSLGNWTSQTDWLGGTLHDLFSILNGTDNANMTPRYRCIAVYNATGSGLTWQGVVAWLTSITPNAALIAIGVDPTAASVVNANVAQGLVVTDEYTAPVGVSFSTPTTFGTAIVLGDIPAGFVKFLWIRVTGTNSSSVANDTATINLSGQSA